MSKGLKGVAILVVVRLSGAAIGLWAYSRNKPRFDVVLNASGWTWGVRDLGRVGIDGWTGIDATFIPLSGPAPAVRMNAAILRGLCGALLTRLVTDPVSALGPITRSRVYRVQIDILGGRDLSQRAPVPFRVAVRDGACDAPDGKQWFVPPYPPPLDRWTIMDVVEGDENADVLVSFVWNGEGGGPALDDFPYAFACRAVIADPPPSRRERLEPDFQRIAIRAYRPVVKIPVFEAGFGRWQQRNFLRAGDTCVFQSREEKA